MVETKSLVSSKKKILFIGAGASYGARKAINIEIPLGQNLLGWLRKKCIEIQNDKFMFMYHAMTSQVREMLNESSEENFELFFQDLDSDKTDEINKFLCLCFCEPKTKYSEFKTGFDDREDDYDKLIEKCDLDENWEVISLNYDVLLEQALKRKGINYHYDNFSFCYPPGDEIGIKIYKPHGSINFRSKFDIHISHGQDREESLKLKPAGLSYTEDGEIVSEPPIYYAVLPDPANIHHIMHSTEHLVIANYRPKKDVNISYQLLKNVRLNAIRAWHTAEEVVVIGVKPVPVDDDKFVNTLLDDIKPSIVYITASQTDADLFIKKQPHSKLHLEGLQKYIQET